MRSWFAGLPISRKLIAMALAVSTIALLAALSGLLLFDVARFRSVAADNAKAMAQVIAENSAAALVFDDAAAGRQILSSVRVLPAVSRACAYRPDGSLFAAYTAAAADTCPEAPSDLKTWRIVAARVPVRRNGRLVGTIFVERRLSDLPSRVMLTAGSALFMLLVAGAIAFSVARRFQQTISRPIVSLADAARQIGRGERTDIPEIRAPADETGELVHAFAEMVQNMLASNRALTREVHERRRMELEREALLAREREASRLKDEFLAAVSHELRTPLHAIMGWTQVLATRPASEETVRKAIDSLLRNTEAQRRVIDDLLDVSRIITGTIELTLGRVDLGVLASSAVEAIEPSADAKQIRATFHPASTPCIIRADVDRLRQIIWNLLSNAVKFTPAGGAIDVTVAPGAAPAEYELAVSDTGIGIAPEFLPFVFDRFSQADGSTTRQFGGLGLGLAIVKDLTELQGGRVAATSAGAGLGARFIVTFPAVTDGADRASALSGGAPGARRLDGVEVVAIDDNPDGLEMVASALTAAGAHVRVAASGPEGLRQLRIQPADIVLCDLAMPEMSGFEVLAGVRELDAAQATVTPVLAVTAYVSGDYRERCLDAGFDDQISKPVDIDRLIERVADAVAAD